MSDPLRMQRCPLPVGECKAVSPAAPLLQRQRTMVMMASLSLSRRSRCAFTAARRSMLDTVSPVTCRCHQCTTWLCLPCPLHPAHPAKP